LGNGQTVTINGNSDVAVVLYGSGATIEGDGHTASAVNGYQAAADDTNPHVICPGSLAGCTAPAP
jgi:hypothetical protein